MPFAEIGKNLDGILKSVNDTAQGPQMKRALADLAGMIASAQGMIQRLDIKQLPELMAGLEETFFCSPSYAWCAPVRVARSRGD